MSMFHLSKSRSLKNTSDIDAVFKNGQKISSELISLYYVGSNSKELKIAFSVGKKSHSLASTRNKLKRLMKEAFRLNAVDIVGEVVISVNAIAVRATTTCPEVDAWGT